MTQEELVSELEVLRKEYKNYQKIAEVVVEIDIKAQIVLLVVIYEVVRTDKQHGGHLSLEREVLPVDGDGLPIPPGEIFLAQGRFFLFVGEPFKKDDPPDKSDSQYQIQNKKEAFSSFSHFSIRGKKGRNNRPFQAMSYSRPVIQLIDQFLVTTTVPNSVSFA